MYRGRREVAYDMVERAVADWVCTRYGLLLDGILSEPEGWRS